MPEVKQPDLEAKLLKSRAQNQVRLLHTTQP